MSDVRWIVSATLTGWELGRVTAPDRRAAEKEAADAFPDTPRRVQSVASARCAALEPSPRADPRKALDNPSRTKRRALEREQRRSAA